MRELLASPQGEKLAYRMHSSQFSQVTVKKPMSHEIAVLGKLGMQIDKSGDGVLETRGNGLLASLTEEATLGIVSRLKNPHGSGVITLLSSYGILNLAQMAEALTDEIQLKSIFERMHWPLNTVVPECFEMMFLVRLAPGNMDDHASEAELLCWRPSQ